MQERTLVYVWKQRRKDRRLRRKPRITLAEYGRSSNFLNQSDLNRQAREIPERHWFQNSFYFIHLAKGERERLIMMCNLNFQSSHYQYWVLSWRSERISAYPCLSARPYVQQFTGIFHFQRHAGFGRNSVCEVSLPAPSSKSPSWEAYQEITTFFKP